MIQVLVADDNPVSRELIREVLDSLDVVILEASHGQEALDQISTHKPDLALLDIQMPLMDGFTVVRRVRQDPRLAHVRLVALTAYAMQGDRQRALAAGFDDYITKPIDGAALRMQVRALVSPP